MAHPNVEILRKIDEAQLSGDIEAFFGFFTDDVKIHIGGKNQLAGDYEGKDKFLDVFTRFNELVGEYSFDTHSYLADDEHGVTIQTSKSQRDGKTLVLREVFVTHHRGDKISEIWYMTIDQDRLDAWIG